MYACHDTSSIKQMSRCRATEYGLAKKHVTTERVVSSHLEPIESSGSDRSRVFADWNMVAVAWKLSDAEESLPIRAGPASL